MNRIETFLLAAALCGSAYCAPGARAQAPVGAVVVGNIADLNRSIQGLGKTGGEIYLAAGEYIVTTPIKLPSNVTLRGAGFATRLRAADNLNDNVISNADLQGGNENIRVMDLSIDGNRENQTYDGRWVIYEQVKNNGLYFEKVDSLRVENVKIENCHGSGIYLAAQCTDINIDKSTLRGNRQYGVEIEGKGIEDVVLESTTIRGNHIGGIVARGPQFRDGPVGLRIIGCNIADHKGDSAIKMAGLQDTILVGNRIDKAIEGGIEVRHMKRLIISDNTLTHIGDGQAGRGNGVPLAITGTPFDTDYANKHVILSNNIMAECESGPFFEASSSDLGHNIGIGYVVNGNISADHVRGGLATHQTKGVAIVGNVMLDLGKTVMTPGTESSGIIMTDRTEGYTVVGNVIYDLREGEQKPEHAIDVRATKNSLVAANVLGNTRQEPLKVNGAKAQGVLVLPNLIDRKPTETRYYAMPESETPNPTAEAKSKEAKSKEAGAAEAN